MNAGIKGRQIWTNRHSYLGSPSKGPVKKQLRDLTSVVVVGGWEREEMERCPKVLARKNFFAPGGCRKGWSGCPCIQTKWTKTLAMVPWVEREKRKAANALKMFSRIFLSLPLIPSSGRVLPPREVIFRG